MVQDLEGYFRDPGFDQIQCGIGRNATCFDGKQELTATQDVEFAKFLARDAVLRNKTLFGIEMTLEARDAGLSLRNERECGIRIPLPDQTFQTLLVVFG